MARRLALLIATYDYEDDGLRQLTAPAHDAEALAAVLRAPAIAGFEVTALINEPHYRVGAAIADLYRDRRRDDLTLLYFTGHGLKDEDGRLYLAMTNTQRSSLLFTSLPAEQIDQAMSACMSRQNVLVLDCCYSGAFPAGWIAKADAAVHTLERFQGRGRTVLTASDATQYSFEGNQPHGTAAQSVFTRHLVAGLRDGSADLDGDGNITIDELYSYVHDQVVEEMPLQRPKKQDNVEGRIVIAQNINWSLPTYLQHALSSPIAAERVAALEGLANLYRVGNDRVRQHVTGQIQRLVDDDSRAVSTAAAAHLQALLPQEGEPSPGPVSEPRQEPEPAVELQVTPPSAVTEPTGPREHAQRASVREAVAALYLDFSARAWRRVRSVDLARISGVLAVLAAALLAAGIAEQGPYGRFPRYVIWYVIAMAAVALASGICTLLPRTRSLIGPGSLIGAAPASVWGLVLLTGHLFLAVAYRIEFAGHVTLLLAACLMGFALGRNRAVHLEPRRPRNLVTWVAAILGGVGAAVGALALSGELYRGAARYPHIGTDFGTWAYLAATVLAVSVPVWAALVTPRRFSISLLAGWIAGAFAICLGTYVWARGTGDQLDVTYAIVFGCGLLLLAAAGTALFRWAATARPGGLRRRLALVAGLAVVPLVAASGAVAVQLLAHIPVIEARPIQVAVSRDGHHLYITMVLASSRGYTDFSREPGRLTAIDTATNTAIGKPVRVGDGAFGVADSLDGSYVYVASVGANSVSVISTLENATVGNPISVGHAPAQLTVSADGRRLLAVDRDHGVSVIDTKANSVLRRIVLPAHSGAVAVSPDGRRIYVDSDDKGDLSVIDSATGKTTAGPVTLGYSPEIMAVSPDGSRLYAAGGPARSAHASRLSVIDTESLKTIGSPATLGEGPHFGMAVSPDGHRVYVTNFFAESVSVIDARTNAVVGAPAQFRGAPGGVTCSPDSHRIYVTLTGSKVAVFRSDTPGTVSLINLSAH
jgi:YVTN family beta-propeller protein